MVQLNLSTIAKFVRPELLLHPSIPLALSGVNPRTIYGQEWWDATRKAVYAENNFCCWACGVYQLDALYKQHLEAHETYLYDYDKREARPGEIVGLCRACHQFIHFRRVKSLTRRKKVVIRGLKILVGANIPVPYWQYKWICNWSWRWDGIPFQILEVQDKIPELLFLLGDWKLVVGKTKYNLGGMIE
jgi:hypothetical protein